MGQYPITREKTHMLKNLDKGSEKRTVYLIKDIKLDKKDINLLNKNKDLHLLSTVDVSQNIRHGCQIQHWKSDSTK
jgi:hypothetical protein